MNFNEGQAPDPRPGFYYVTVMRSAEQYKRLRGPFVNDHAGALGAVTDAMNEARRLDPRAEWYSYGTCRSETDRGPGLLDIGKCVSIVTD